MENKKRRFIPEIIIISLLSIISGNFGNYLRWVIIIIFLIILAIRLRAKIYFVKMPGQEWYIAFCLISIMGGIYSLISSQTLLWPVIRDIILFTTYYISWMYFCNLTIIYKKNCIVMWNSVFLASGIIALYTFITALPRLTEGLDNFSEFVEGMPSGQWAMAIGIYLYLIHPPEIKKFYIHPIFDKILFLAEITAVALSLSRTCIIILACLLLPSLLHRKKIMTLIRYIAIFGIVMYGVYLLSPSIMNVFLDKVMNSFTEISSSNSWTIESVVENWRGYEVYAAIQEFEKYNVLQMFIGKGFGAIVHTPYAWLVTGENGLPFLHNGYFTALIKGGILGCISYFMIFICQYIEIKRLEKSDFFYRRTCIGIIIGLMITSIVVQGIFFGSMYFVPLLILSWSIVSNSTRSKKLTKENVL